MAVLVGKQAPDFTAAAVLPDGDIVEDFNLREYLNGSYGLVFFYPLDFTFVCPSEILAYSNRVPKFEEMNVKVVAVSVDSQFTHAAWRNTAPNDGGLGPVKFPMVADMTKQIARDYDVLIEKDGVALRGTFLIDRDGVVRHQLVNDLPSAAMPTKRCAWPTRSSSTRNTAKSAPAGWNKGDEGMKADAEGVAKYLSTHAEAL